MDYLKLCFYVPETHLETVKDAVFSAGAGRLDAYDQCAWQIKGTGQFRPSKSSKPFIGEKESINYIAEFRVEVLLTQSSFEPVRKALLDAHPYETPAYDFVKVQK